MGLATAAASGMRAGGIAEMFLYDEHKEIIKLKDRKGFVRIAVEAGADLVPCYHFGNSRLFKWGPKFLEPYARYAQQQRPPELRWGTGAARMSGPR